MIMPGYPKTSQRKIKPKLKLKAAHGREFLPALQYMLINMFELGTEHQKTRLQCVSELVNFYAELDKRVDDGSSSAKVGNFGRMHLLLYRELNDTSRHHTKLPLYPKHNLFAHAVSGCTVNPKLDWSYSDTSETRLAATVAGVASQTAIGT